MANDFGLLLSWLEVGLLVGLLYSPIALGLSWSFRTLNYPDLSCEGTFVFAGASAVAVLNHTHSVVLSILSALLCGGAAGALTACFNLIFGVSRLLSGIITWGVLYSLAIRIMGGLSNLPTADGTVFSLLGGDESIFRQLVLAAGATAAVYLIIVAISRSRFGRTSRALGDQAWFVVSMGISPRILQTAGLAFSNAIIGLGAALVVHYREVCDINMATGLLVSGLAAMILGEAVVNARTVAGHLASVIVGSIVYNLAISAFYYDWPFSLGQILMPSDVRLVSALLLLISASIVSKFRSQYKLYASEW
jgi:putative tryptophan/tyrosine transport system permease protein